MLTALWSREEAGAMTSLIISEYAGINAASQLAFGEKMLSPAVTATIYEAAVRAAAGEPIQYIFGYTIFNGYRIEVAPGVLIPRPETEEMTELIIKNNPGFVGRITDLCTGSGCIAIALAGALPGAKLFATENSKDALKIAGRNILSTMTTVKLVDHDLLNDDPSVIPACDIIVSNPPYVTGIEKDEMHVNVLGHEPHEALFVPGDDPLLYYRKIAEVAGMKLAPGGELWLEVNSRYADETAGLFGNELYVTTEVIDDINGKNRFVRARKR